MSPIQDPERGGVIGLEQYGLARNPHTPPPPTPRRGHTLRRKPDHDPKHCTDTSTKARKIAPTQTNPPTWHDPNTNPNHDTNPNPSFNPNPNSTVASIGVLNILGGNAVDGGV